VQQSTMLVASPTIRVKYIPDPKDIVNLAEGTPYVVPDGKLLIITDYTLTNAVCGGSVTFSMHPRIRINGVDTWGTGWADASGTDTGAGVLSHALGTGVRANAGETVTLHANWYQGSPQQPPAWTPYMGMPEFPKMFASGYLANAN